MDINYTSGRKLNRELINRLATCEYISEHRNLFITGATGCGKTYMACAFGMEACMQYYSTMFDAAAEAGADTGGHNHQCSFHSFPPKLNTLRWGVVAA